MICSFYRASIGAIEDPILIEELLSYILTKAQDQDIVFYCHSLGNNPVSRRRVATFLKDNYDDVSIVSYSSRPMFTRCSAQQAICNQFDVEVSH